MGKTALAWFGGAVLVLWVAGFLGIGHFRMYYGSAPVECKQTKEGS